MSKRHRRNATTPIKPIVQPNHYITLAGRWVR